ncbi:MAG: hypothetical protein LBN32_02665 [Helicobacteraceae bacterium]|jgi:hypothetical protein|nr:hypothetical protein [Helicobacteraceae bacterium]
MKKSENALKKLITSISQRVAKVYAAGAKYGLAAGVALLCLGSSLNGILTFNVISAPAEAELAWWEVLLIFAAAMFFLAGGAIMLEKGTRRE